MFWYVQNVQKYLQLIFFWFGWNIYCFILVTRTINVEVVIYHEKKIHMKTLFSKKVKRKAELQNIIVSLLIWLQSFRSTWWVEFITTLCWSIVLCKASQRGLPLRLRWYSYPSSGRGQATWSTMDSSTATRQRHPTRLWRYVTEEKWPKPVPTLSLPSTVCWCWIK